MNFRSQLKVIPIVLLTVAQILGSAGVGRSSTEIIASSNKSTLESIVGPIAFAGVAAFA
jgi:hypothetical protein